MLFTDPECFNHLENLILTAIKRDPRYMDWGLKITEKTVHPLKLEWEILTGVKSTRRGFMTLRIGIDPMTECGLGIQFRECWSIPAPKEEETEDIPWVTVFSFAVATEETIRKQAFDMIASFLEREDVKCKKIGRSNRTPARPCCACKTIKPESQFSKTQLMRRPNNKKTCQDCVAQKRWQERIG
jgi:hypothetical protein